MPMRGDESPEVIYQAVGAALTAWEGAEARLARIFALIVGTDAHNVPAHRAYGSVASFNGRQDLLIAAVEGFMGALPNKKARDRYELAHANVLALAKRMKEFSARRNEIGHGAVGPYHVQVGQRFEKTYLLLPADYATRKQELAGAVKSKGKQFGLTVPKYGYNTEQINLFCEHFRSLHIEAQHVAMTWDHLRNLPNRQKPSPGRNRPPRAARS